MAVAPDPPLWVAACSPPRSLASSEHSRAPRAGLLACLAPVAPSITRRAAAVAPAVALGAAALCAALVAGCGTQVYTPSSAASMPPSPASVASSRQALEQERAQVAAQYWPATKLVMKTVPGMEAKLGIKVRFEEALGVFTACGAGVAPDGLQYQVSVILEAHGHLYEDLGPPLGQVARVAEQALTAAGWGPFATTQGVSVAARHDGVTATFDNDPAATETDTSFATALVYDLAGACVPVPGSTSAVPNGGGEAGGGPDAGPPPGDGSAGDGLPPVRDTYGLGPASLQPLALPG
jgi:hypothetical protein